MGSGAVITHFLTKKREILHARLLYSGLLPMPTFTFIDTCRL